MTLSDDTKLIPHPIALLGFLTALQTMMEKGLGDTPDAKALREALETLQENKPVLIMHLR